MITIEMARKVLGDKAKDLNDSQVQDIVTKMHLLAKTVLDSYEVKKFGKTLKELNED